MIAHVSSCLDNRLFPGAVQSTPCGKVNGRLRYGRKVHRTDRGARGACAVLELNWCSPPDGGPDASARACSDLQRYTDPKATSLLLCTGIPACLSEPAPSRLDRRERSQWQPPTVATAEPASISTAAVPPARGAAEHPRARPQRAAPSLPEVAGFAAGRSWSWLSWELSRTEDLEGRCRCGRRGKSHSSQSLPVTPGQCTACRCHFRTGTECSSASVRDLCLRPPRRRQCRAVFCRWVLAATYRS